MVTGSTPKNETELISLKLEMHTRIFIPKLEMHTLANCIISLIAKAEMSLKQPFILAMVIQHNS